MEEKNTDFEKELLNRIEQIEEDSRKIKRMSRRDYIVVGIIVMVCLVVVVAGAFIHPKKDELKEMTEDNIKYLSVRYYIEEADEYSVDGALCYPEGWETFIEDLTRE